jgi:biopolymer transport protein ExbD/biopolymer transport protein TolR
MAIAVRDEGSKVNSNINVTPMVDVMLVLLIIFMVITPMLNNKVNVDLARVNSPQEMPDANKEDSVVIAITRDGNVFLGANQVSTSDLGSKVSDLLANKPTKTVYLRADARARYGTVQDVVDDIRTAGVDQVDLLADRRLSNEPTTGGM